MQQKAAKNGMSKCPIDDVRDDKSPYISSQIYGKERCPILRENWDEKNAP